jgi:hypothetical protein
MKGKGIEAVQIGDRDSFVEFAKSVLVWSVCLSTQSWDLRSFVDHVSVAFKGKAVMNASEAALSGAKIAIWPKFALRAP